MGDAMKTLAAVSDYPQTWARCGTCCFVPVLLGPHVGPGLYASARARLFPQEKYVQEGIETCGR